MRGKKSESLGTSVPAPGCDRGKLVKRLVGRHVAVVLESVTAVVGEFKLTLSLSAGCMWFRWLIVEVV